MYKHYKIPNQDLLAYRCSYTPHNWRVRDTQRRCMTQITLLRTWILQLKPYIKLKNKIYSWSIDIVKVSAYKSRSFEFCEMTKIFSKKWSSFIYFSIWPVKQYKFILVVKSSQKCEDGSHYNRAGARFSGGFSGGISGACKRATIQSNLVFRSSFYKKW